MPEQKQKRLRIFSGPNGSGKSTVFDAVRLDYSTGPFINADEIESAFSTIGSFDLETLGVKIEPEHFYTSIKQSGYLPKANHANLPIDLTIQDQIVHCPKSSQHSYSAAALCEIIRDSLIRNRVAFSMETVMSHPSKINLIQSAREQGYRCYLYFISTSDPRINVDRVANRVSKGGHPVPTEKIIQRYNRSLRLLKDAIEHCHRSYIFDNSGTDFMLCAEIDAGKKSVVLHTPDLPAWAKTYGIASITDKLGSD